MARGVKNGDYVKVTWIDSSASYGWRSIEESQRMSLSACITVGTLLNRTDGVVRVAGTTDYESDLMVQVISIPKVAVTSVTRLVEEY